MREKVQFLGLDVHAETIAVAVVEQDGEVRSLGVIANRAESVRKLIRKLGAAESLRACYEAGPTGYVLYWQLTELGVECAVVAPTLVPVKAGDRVKTDRRDAVKLARCHGAGELTSVWVPDAGAEALRDLVRAREAAKQDQLLARHRLSKFLLRTGQRPAPGLQAWTQPHMAWVRRLRYAQAAQKWTRLDLLHEVEHMAKRVKGLEEAIGEAVKLAPAAMQEVMRGLQALRGIAEISAVTVVAELGRISRFASARQFNEQDLAGILCSHPDATLVELQAELENKTGLRVSTQHLWRVVKRLGFRLKKSHSTPKSGTRKRTASGVKSSSR